MNNSKLHRIEMLVDELQTASPKRSAGLASEILNVVRDTQADAATIDAISPDSEAQACVVKDDDTADSGW